MSPVHHDGEAIRVHASWQSWIDEAIAEARERGDFDNLPGTGEPLQIKENPFACACAWELAFHVLENADMTPPWMEMTREIREGKAELDLLREQTRQRLAALRALPPMVDQQAPPTAQRGAWWWPLRRRAAQPERNEPRTPSLAALEAERQAARRRYLEKAADVDEIIAAYNAWLPDTLRRLQKPRLRAAAAAREFEAACPPLSTGAEHSENEAP